MAQFSMGDDPLEACREHVELSPRSPHTSSREEKSSADDHTNRIEPRGNVDTVTISEVDNTSTGIKLLHLSQPR